MTTSGFCLCNSNPKHSFVCGLYTAKKLWLFPCCCFCVSMSSSRLALISAGAEAAYSYSVCGPSQSASFCFVMTLSYKYPSICPPPPLSFFHPGSRYLYADPLHCNMTYLFLRLLKDDLREYTYAARLAGLVYGIASGMNAILVSMVISLSRDGRWIGWRVELAAFECASRLSILLLSADGMGCFTFKISLWSVCLGSWKLLRVIVFCAGFRCLWRCIYPKEQNTNRQ